MSSGSTRMVTGSLLGTGAIRNVDVVGFRPSRVEVRNVAGLNQGYWQDSMPDDAMVLVITAGTITYETSDGITPRAAGFALGANSDLNVSGEELHWVAFD